MSVISTVCALSVLLPVVFGWIGAFRRYFREKWAEKPAFMRRFSFSAFWREPDALP